MSLPSDDVATKVSSNGKRRANSLWLQLCSYLEAAQLFVDTYYMALNHKRNTLASFYIKPTPTNPLNADISLNGNIVPTPADLQTLFEKQMPTARYEVQSFDCQVLNPNYNVGASDSELGPDPSGRKMSLMVIVSGYVKYGDARDAETRGFTENIILVPNFEVRGKGRDRTGKNWLIQSQNFRMVL